MTDHAKALADALRKLLEQRAIGLAQTIVVANARTALSEYDAAAEASPPVDAGKCAGGYTVPVSGPCRHCGATEDDACKYAAEAALPTENHADLGDTIRHSRTCDWWDGAPDTEGPAYERRMALDTIPCTCALKWRQMVRTERELHTAWRKRAEEAEAAPREDGARTLPFDRDELGRLVREAWIKWATAQPNPKPSWLVPYEQLSDADKEADRQIGEAVARWTLIGDAANAALSRAPQPDTVTDEIITIALQAFDTGIGDPNDYRKRMGAALAAVDAARGVQ
jgi:hypothetical protein